MKKYVEKWLTIIVVAYIINSDIYINFKGESIMNINVDSQEAILSRDIVIVPKIAKKQKK